MVTTQSAGCFGLVDGPNWVISTIFTGIQRAGKDATEEAIYEWVCTEMYRQCAEWVRVFHLTDAWIALDGKECWRHDVFPSYKSERKQRKRDPRIAALYGRIIYEYLPSQGLPILQHPSCEAEDVIFHSRAFLREKRAAREFYVFSRDRDLLQMEDTRGDTRVVGFRLGGRPPTRTRLVGSDLLWKKILTGDRSDSIPGLRIWHRLSDSLQRRILSDHQFRIFWIEKNGPEVQNHIDNNRRLIDLQCCPTKIQGILRGLCGKVYSDRYGSHSA